ncbi:MAG: carboxypeptidase-like regulatory domain-containing protein [Flavobacterium sp.]|nr:MAG: carboxypeptidase-like regulatory domain-containing protein [Flavobacterium sp.]
MKKIFLLTLLIAFFGEVHAQLSFSISGTVKNVKDGELPGATIFLDGTEKKTYSNEKGEFKLDNLSPGTYQLSVHFVGYKAYKKNIIIEDKSIITTVLLEHSEQTLKEVVITSTASKNKYLAMFLKSFLGDTENGNSCRLLNPDILKFSEQQLTVTAKTNAFLEIINENLGYNIKYSLRDFTLNRLTSVASYAGECIFESLKGSESEEKVWTENRKAAYEGSLMHFMRSLYANTLDKDGFYCYYILDYNKPKQRLGPLITPDNFVNHEKKDLATIKLSSPLFVAYDPAFAHNLNPASSNAGNSEQAAVERTSIVAPYLGSAIIDSKGSIVDYRSFLIRRYWGTKRLGDQLPYEYMLPDTK